MKKILVLISVFTLLAFSKNFTGNTTVIITPNSKLIIKGKTNVNSFICQYNISKLNKPIKILFKNHGDKITFEKTTLVLDNVNFDCGGAGMNNDFKELLKSDIYPNIFVNLKEIRKDQNNQNLVNALIDLEIAGVTKSYVVPVELKGDDLMNVKGILALNLRDYNLEPPKKALGLIVVKDVIEINFELAVKEY
ncbi:YceI family protein [Confluentibacter sediminis]|uniref:YceI family protein n=1 Tax=Confluentibacter sediminis TaxID=2219045 RepID=UPI000DAD5F36|nr:YceI family protein [Confluentibacter sediminis]